MPRRFRLNLIGCHSAARPLRWSAFALDKFMLHMQHGFVRLFRERELVPFLAAVIGEMAAGHSIFSFRASDFGLPPSLRA